MSKFTQWYLVELDGMLRGHISSDRLHDLLNEVEEHLTLAIEERMAKGMSQEEAELAALDSMGSPRRLADAQLKAVGKSRLVSQALTVLRIAPLVLGAAFFIAGFLGEEVFHPMVGLFWLGTIAVLIPATFIARTVPWRGLVVVGVCGVLGLAAHQGISHVYVPNELTLADARQQVAGFDSGIVQQIRQQLAEQTKQLGAPSADLSAQLADTEQKLRIQEELSKSPLRRFLERLPQATVALTIVMAIHGLVLWLLCLIPRRQAAHWLHRRLA